MAAREVAVRAATSIRRCAGRGTAAADEKRLSGAWRCRRAGVLAGLCAPAGISTIAVTRRETNSWRWPIFMVTYLFVLAYLAAGATYWLAVAAGL